MIWGRKRRERAELQEWSRARGAAEKQAAEEKRRAEERVKEEAQRKAAFAAAKRQDALNENARRTESIMGSLHLHGAEGDAYHRRRKLVDSLIYRAREQSEKEGRFGDDGMAERIESLTTEELQERHSKSTLVIRLVAHARHVAVRDGVIKLEDARAFREPLEAKLYALSMEELKAHFEEMTSEVKASEIEDGNARAQARLEKENAAHQAEVDRAHTLARQLKQVHAENRAVARAKLPTTSELGWKSPTGNDKLVEKLSKMGSRAEMLHYLSDRAWDGRYGMVVDHNGQLIDAEILADEAVRLAELRQGDLDSRQAIARRNSDQYEELDRTQAQDRARALREKYAQQAEEARRRENNE